MGMRGDAWRQGGDGDRVATAWSCALWYLSFATGAFFHTPSETAAEMGAGAGVTGSPGRDDGGDGGARQRSESDAVELCASSSSTALADLEADDGGALKRRCE